MKITSVNNELIKNTAKLLQRKYRDEQGLFILEGEKCIEEAINCGMEPVYLFTLDDYDKFPAKEKFEVNEAIMSKISSTVSPPKCVAVCRQRQSEWKDDFKRIVLLENIKDAGNLGTIIRTSCAFNIDAIILYGDTVDLYNPKCIRSSVGNLWKIPIFNINNIIKLKDLCKNFIPIATLPKNNNSVWLNDFTDNENLLIMFGTEATGLSDDLIDYANKNGKSVTIEMNSAVESLNLSISAGIILYKIFVKK